MFECRTEDGMEVVIELSRHARKRLLERGVLEFAVYGSIISIIDDILDLKNGSEFAVIDQELDIAVICSVGVGSIDPKITITIVTVIDRSHIFVREGTAVLLAN